MLWNTFISLTHNRNVMRPKRKCQLKEFAWYWNVFNVNKKQFNVCWPFSSYYKRKWARKIKNWFVLLVCLFALLKKNRILVCVLRTLVANENSCCCLCVNVIMNFSHHSHWKCMHLQRHKNITYLPTCFFYFWFNLNCFVCISRTRL